jgi:molecular chaperone GrpE
LKGHNEKKEEGRKIPVNGGSPSDEEIKEPKDSPSEAHTCPADMAASQELDKAKAEAKEFQDKYLRLYADTENFKKRMARETLEREKFYNEGMIKELLPVLDNLERAISHETPGCEGIMEGVKMVRKQLVDALTKFGVSKVESVGLPFDPNKQQAIMQVETDEYEPGTVVEEVQKGYMLNDRLVRPAMVTVAKKPSES